MAKKKRQSALILTDVAWEILKKYRNAYGVKNTLSVGLELFDKLACDEQFARVSASDKADEIVRQAEGAAAKQRKRPRRSDAKEAS